ncbi:MAG: hypothetical protein AAF226_03030 [Verrucomicrobiota bacterium]
MKCVICDASPLIFLAKLNELDLVAEVLKCEIIVLQSTVDEILIDRVPEIERIRLEKFLQRVTISNFKEIDYPSKSLSKSDRAVLNWAIQNQPDWLIADERLLRRIAQEEGLRVIGFIGVLFAATQQNIRTKAEVRALINDAVGIHSCHISVELYQRLMAELD